MDFRSQVRGAPRALKDTLEKARPEYDELVRRTHWGDGPLFIVGGASSYPAALAGAYAFEELLGWPVVAARAANFLNYTVSVLRPKSVVLVISGPDESGETLEAVRQARTRGATVLAMAPSATNPVAESADGVFLIRPEEGHSVGLQAELCQHAAMGFLSIVAAGVLKRRHQKLDDLEHEFQKLPDDAEWVLTRLADAVKSLAAAFGEESSLVLSGGGSYYPAAIHAARSLAALGTIRARAVDAAELAEGSGSAIAHQEAVLFFSGTRSRLKKKIAEAAQAARRAGSKVFSVTDANDRELAEASSLAVLLPMVNEMPGSCLELLFAQCLIAHLSHHVILPTKQAGPKSGSLQGKSHGL
jgi:glucosamine--fructose-6-phosphate aminotransferase (isomerizing)